MHITSGLSPASGAMLDASSIHFYADGVDCGTYEYIAMDHAVPESSHTVEIEYVYEQPETLIAPCDEMEQEKTAIQESPPQKEDKIDEDQETDLTNLTWLQNITNIMSLPQFAIPPMSPNPQTKTQPQNTRLQKFNETIAKCQKDFTDNKQEYRTDSEKKPPYSYSTLICVAMRYNGNKMTLSAIYSWIRENFKYYRNADPTWQNSIRHNLSLNKVFVKVARSKQEPGKGGFWKLDLAHLEGTKRISNRPKKKKKASEQTPRVSEEAIAVANIPKPEATLINQTVTLHLPEYSNVMQGLPEMTLEGNIGANVIVEPAVPPPLMPEEDLTSLLLNPTEWDDLQLDMLDNYLDSCFK